MNVTNEEKYGYMQELSLFYPGGSIAYGVEKKYPLPLNDDGEGESLMMNGHLFINILWSHISEKETRFLHGLCEGISIYKDPIYDIIFLGFCFSRKLVIVGVTEDEAVVQDWISYDIDAIAAFFFLIEATNKKILQIRNIGLQRDYIAALKKALTNYKKPNIDTVRKYSSSIDASVIFNKAEFRWIYSKEHDKFFFIPKEIET